MKSIWKDMICMLAGLWLWVSPFVLHFKLAGAAADASLVGIVIGSIAAMAIATQQTWEEWVNLVLGVWLIASPWLLGFSDRPVALGDMVIVGSVIVLLSLWSLARRPVPRQTAA